MQGKSMNLSQTVGKVHETTMDKLFTQKLTFRNVSFDVYFLKQKLFYEWRHSKQIVLNESLNEKF